MKFAIVGSRTCTNETRVKHFAYVQIASSDYSSAIEVISGGAMGVDTFAENLAKENDWILTVIKPDYEKYPGWQAPKERNSLIVEACDEVIAFWDGKSGGTLDTIQKAVKADKRVTIYRS